MSQQQQQHKPGRDEQAGAGGAKGREDKSGQAKPPANQSRRKKVILIVSAVLLVVGLAAGIPYYLYTLSHITTDDAFIAGYVTQIAPRVAGQVQNVYVQDNQWVEAGQVLLEIDPRDYQAPRGPRSLGVVGGRGGRAIGPGEPSVRSHHVGGGPDGSRGRGGHEHLGGGDGQGGGGVGRGRLRAVEGGGSTAAASAEQAQADADAARTQAVYDQADLKRYEQLFKESSATAQQLQLAQANGEPFAGAAQGGREEGRCRRGGRLGRGGIVGGAGGEGYPGQGPAGPGRGSRQGRPGSPRRRRGPRSRSSPWPRPRSGPARAKVRQARVLADRSAGSCSSYTRVIAPRHGHITHKTVRRGQYVQPGQSVLAIVPPEVWVVANYKETELTDMRPGQPVEITVDAFGGEGFQGHVDSIQAGTGSEFSLLPPENATGNYIKVVQRVPVKILFDKLPDPQAILPRSRA